VALKLTQQKIAAIKVVGDGLLETDEFSILHLGKISNIITI